MTTVVVDASAIAAILFQEPQGAGIAVLLREMNLVAPRLLRHEIVSVATKKLRAQPGERFAIGLAVSRYRNLGVIEKDVVATEVFSLAIERDLSAYDASYLWLARRDGLNLITLDAALAGAAALP